MDDILQQLIINKDSIYQDLNNYFNGVDCRELIPILDGINKRVLFDSYFHGLHHSQKTCFFAYLIGKKLNLNDNDLKILLDAAIYHDIGRNSDVEDNIHGYTTAMEMDKTRKNYGEFYASDINFTYLKAICDMHCIDDVRMKRIFEGYELENPDIEYEKFELLAKILKDADALDRQRFKKTSQAALKEKYLRFDISKELTEIAKLINSHYNYKISEILYNKNKDKYEGDAIYSCFHGIGFDFFKLESILNHGILSSFEAVKEGITTTRNFNGNNGNIWISVVDSKDVSKDGKAYNNFIKNGISFYCMVPALEKGRKGKKNNCEFAPVNSGEYEDEHFVFNKIDYNNIHSLIINKEVLNKGIDELDYLSGSLNYDIIEQKIFTYADEIKAKSGVDVDLDEIKIILEEFKQEVIRYEKETVDNQKKTNRQYLENVEIYVSRLNKIVSKWMVQLYSTLLKKDGNIKVSDVVFNILSNYKDKIKNIYENEECVIVLNNLEKKQKKEVVI